MTEKSEALRLADWLEGDGGGLTTLGDCAAELRRLSAENAALGVHLSERMKDLFKVEAQRDALLEIVQAAYQMADAMLKERNK